MGTHTVHICTLCTCTPHVCRKYSFFVVDNAWWYSKCGILHLSQLIQAVFLCSRISSTLHLYVLVIRSQPVEQFRKFTKNKTYLLHTCIICMYTVHVHTRTCMLYTCAHGYYRHDMWSTNTRSTKRNDCCHDR